METKRIGAEKLQDWTVALFCALGVSRDSALAAADSLVDADLRGIGTHGVVRIPIYVERLQRGRINKQPQARVTAVGTAAERLDGDNGLGQWVGAQAMDRACTLAENAGIGIVIATRSNHFGTAGWFARRANARGCAGIVWSQCESLVVPFGGSQRFFGTNPFCMSMPWTGHEPVTLDMATSAVPLGKVEIAKVTTGTIPPDWAVDAEGKPTTDPFKVHALQPMAGPKGSGLAMLIELLSGALAGTVCGPRLHRLYDDFDHEQGLAQTFIAIKTDIFAAHRQPDEVIAEMVSDLRQQKPAEGVAEILLPGEIEARSAERNRREGVALSPKLSESLRELGEQHGIKFPA